MTRGSTNLPDVGVTGGIEDPVPESDSPSPKRSVERERRRTFSGVIGKGAEIVWDVIGAYIDCGRTRLPLEPPLGEEEGEVAAEGGASPALMWRPEFLPMVSSFMSSNSSALWSSRPEDVETGEVEKNAVPSSRDCEREWGVLGCSRSSLRSRSRATIGVPSATV